MPSSRLLTAALGLCLAATPVSRAATAALPLPDQPEAGEVSLLRERLDRDANFVRLLAAGGKTAEATKLEQSLWDRYDAEFAARQAEAADLSLASLNPYLPTAERQAAAAALAGRIKELAALAGFANPDLADRPRHLEKTGQPVSEAARTRAQTQATLRQIRQKIQMAQLADYAVTDLRRAVVARLEREAAAAQPLEAAVTEARRLASTAEAIQGLAKNFADAGTLDFLFQQTADSFAYEATLTALIESDPSRVSFWLARARGRFQFGWRQGAVVDLTVASHLEPANPGVAELADRIKAIHPIIAAILPEFVDRDAANAVIRARQAAASAGQPPTELAPELERAARAAVRNQARRLYAASFTTKPELRRQALAYAAQVAPLPPGLFPFLPPELGQQFAAELEAAKTDASKTFAILQRYAPLYGTAEGFWQRQLAVLLAANQAAGARAALDVAQAAFPAAAWVNEARSKLDPAPSATTAAKP